VAFIRKKLVRGKQYYYVVESKLIKGKVKQKVIYYIGTADTLLNKLNIEH